MSFEGFRGDFVGFFRGLEMDNSKAYFERHRAEYERDVRGPMAALVADLEPVLGPGKIFRINRDVRFSADKSPYKTNVAATIGPLYVHLDARRLFLGTGVYHGERDWLNAFRAAVDSPRGEELGRIVEAGLRRGLSFASEESLRTAPRGYAADHPRIEILRWRNVVAGRAFEIEPWIARAEAKDRILQTWESMRPFSDWLRENVPSGEVSRP
jgi:uncharacterized protein (TIGR02453 family)